MHTPTLAPVTAVILAGGKASRMGGTDKALATLHGRTLVAHVLGRLRLQAAELLLNSGRPAGDYAAFGLPVIPDPLPDQPGPLAGLLAGMEAARHELVLAVPCDTPFLPHDLVARLLAAMAASGAPATAARSGGQRHPAVLLARRSLAPALRAHLAAGGRAVHAWLAEAGAVWADFDDCPEAFDNANDAAGLARLEARAAFDFPLPLIGFAAWSGTGKTTLLERLIPALGARGVRAALVKHAHHDFDLDTPGKDSWRLRKAGAVEVLVASRARFALVHEQRELRPEPRLAELLPRLDPHAADLVLVEGFKHEPIAKIELHRPTLGKPLLFSDDPRIVAVASDGPVATQLPLLDLNDPGAIADFLLHQFGNICGVRGLAPA